MNSGPLPGIRLLFPMLSRNVDFDGSLLLIDRRGRARNDGTEMFAAGPARRPHGCGKVTLTAAGYRLVPTALFANVLICLFLPRCPSRALAQTGKLGNYPLF
jgi:hypothetical protein